MRWDFKGDCWVDVTVADLAKHTILHIEEWKPGVKRLHLRWGNHFFLAYCREDVYRAYGNLLLS